MSKKLWYGIGLMSGTSLDGLDLTYVEFDTSRDSINYKIICSETIRYNKVWKSKLTKAFHSSAQEITHLNTIYGKFIGEQVNSFIKKNKINNLDFVASHGHTIFHNPNQGYTLQIGDAATIAATCNQQVVSDFRTQDIALGGQGAPLVPIGDRLLFSDFDYCINIGGFANISFEKNKKRVAFDVCPANIILNHYTQQIGLDYDDKGQLAQTGKINQALLKDLESLRIYQSSDAMSNEFVLSDIIPLINSHNLEIAHILRTVIEHVAEKIGKILKVNTTSLITGGGAYNDFMIKRIKHHSDSKIIIPNSELIEYKEALIFALLGLLKLRNKTNILASVTGARHDHSSGIVIRKSLA